MITLNLTGIYEGEAENKTYPGKAYFVVRPCVQPPAGLLRAVTCPKKFGAPESANEQLGAYAVLCDADQLPRDINIGARIALSASFWPIAQPTWSERSSQVTYGQRHAVALELVGEVKPAGNKPVPFTFNARVPVLARMRDPRDPSFVTLKCAIPATPPAWVLRDGVNVAKKVNGKPAGFVKASELIDAAELRVPLAALPQVASDDLIDFAGACWPVSIPYFDNKQNEVLWKVVPETRFFVQTAKAVPAEKAASKA